MSLRQTPRGQDGVFSCLAGLSVLTSNVPPCQEGEAGCSLNCSMLSDQPPMLHLRLGALPHQLC